MSLGQTAGGTLLIEIAMVIFMVVFVLIVLWTILARPGRFRRAARMPLDDRTIMTPRDEPEDRATAAAPSGNGKDSHP